MTLQASCFSQSAQAALGEKSDVIEMDRQTVPGKRLPPVAHGLYSVHEIQGTGFNLKEYVSPSGVVFGMAWRGKLPMSLNAIFGSYLNDYEQAAQRAGGPKKTARHRVRVPHVLIQGSQVIFERLGGGAAARFKVTVPQLMPTGVSADEI